MRTLRRFSTDPFPELSYANPAQPRLKRWFIRSVEELSGRDRYARLYATWRNTIVPTRERVFGRMLELVNIRVQQRGGLPALTDAPLVIVANHPFGIADGAAALALAESLGRPFRVMINAELLKIPEMADYSLPVDFNETKEALRNNLAVRHEAVRLLKEGVTIVIFPGGGVATAPRGFGQAQDFPWKMFPFRLIQEARANVLPLYFSGQNGRLFHLVSGPMSLLERQNRFARMIGSLSLTMRTSLLIREFAKRSGKTVDVRIGQLVPWERMEPLRERSDLRAFLQQRVMELAPSRRANEPVSSEKAFAA